MPLATIDRLIVNSPNEEPAKHCRHDRWTRLFGLVDGRRPAAYVVASSDSKAFDDPGVFVEIPLFNRIRPVSGHGVTSPSGTALSMIARNRLNSTACCLR